MPPTLTATYTPQTKTQGNVTVKIQANEAIQNIEGWELSQDKTTLTKEYTENQTEEIEVKDELGNITKQKIEVTQIDRTAPQIQSITYSQTEETKNPVTVEIKLNEEVQELQGWLLSQDKRTLTKEYQKNTNEEITIKDLAGNQVAAQITITNIIEEIKTPYQITEDGYITGILPETSKDDFKANFDVTVTLNQDSEEAEGTEETEETNIIKTGMKAQLLGKEYTLVVTGDLNKDGKLNLIDLVQIKRHIIGMQGSILANEALKASDINQDGQTNLIDLVQMKQVIVGMRHLELQ